VFVRDGGSGRSVEGFSLIDAVQHCEEYLEHFGGHAAACGLHIKEDASRSSVRKSVQYAREHQTPEMLNPCIKVECSASMDEMTEQLTLDLMKMGPYGNGNRRPFFIFKGLVVVEFRTMGKEQQFVSFIGQQIGRDPAMKFISFKPTPLMKSLVRGQCIDVIAEPSLNTWKGNTSVQLMVRDIREHGVDEATDNKKPDGMFAS
jgi:single-stranded-DNA-specific exonuclease